jgi:hypothetical protein
MFGAFIIIGSGKRNVKKNFLLLFQVIFCSLRESDVFNFELQKAKRNWKRKTEKILALFGAVDY